MSYASVVGSDGFKHKLSASCVKITVMKKTVAQCKAGNSCLSAWRQVMELAAQVCDSKSFGMQCKKQKHDLVEQKV